MFWATPSGGVLHVALLSWVPSDRQVIVVSSKFWSELNRELWFCPRFELVYNEISLSLSFYWSGHVPSSLCSNVSGVTSLSGCFMVVFFNNV